MRSAGYREIISDGLYVYKQVGQKVTSWFPGIAGSNCIEVSSSSDSLVAVSATDAFDVETLK